MLWVKSRAACRQWFNIHSHSEEDFGVYRSKARGEEEDKNLVPLLEMLCLQIDPVNKKVKTIDGKEI